MTSRGFRTFVYPRHLRRDNHRRMILIEYFGQEILEIRMVLVDGTWVIEKKDVTRVDGSQSSLDLSGLVGPGDLLEFLKAIRDRYESS
ncbi:MAG: hypothetical protein RLZZ519_2580 [Bacteroidota bacterium]